MKTYYADGSAKTAVLTMARPTLAAGQSAQVELSATTAVATPALNYASALANHQFSVAMTSSTGTTTQIDVLSALKAAIASGDASFWQQGPLAVQARVEIPLAGSQRMVFDVTLFADGGMNVDAQFNNDRAMEATGGRASYSVAVTMDGKQAGQFSLNQGQYQNWHEGFSSNGLNGGQGLGDPASGWLNLRHDIAHLQATGAVANYDLQRGVDPGLLDSWAAAAAAPGWNAPLATNGVAVYMPGAGGRADIGFTTASNAGWLISQDPRAAVYALGQAEAASGVPWNLRDSANETWLGTDAYPNLWTDPRGGVGKVGDAQSGGLTQPYDQSYVWTLDASHQPDLSYVPYLLTGQRWMLDNLQAQASWNIMSHWPVVRGGDADLLAQGNQVRGTAWSLRQVDEAAWVSPAGSVEKAAFAEASAANWAWLVKQIPLWTQQQGEAYGWVPGEYGYIGALPPWQQDYFASTAIAAASRGNADALTFLQWQTNFLVGRFTKAAQGFDEHDGAAYLIAIGDSKTGALYKTWAEIGAQTDARGWSNNQGWDQSQGDYAQLALATLSGIAKLTGSAAAAQAYADLIADAPPFTSDAAFYKDPVYGLAAPGAKPIATPSPPPSPPSVDTGLVPLSIVLAADSWQGDPQAVVLVDGVQVIAGSISAPNSGGGATISLGQVSAGVAHTVTVRFLNDAWGGTAATDRNLHVKDVIQNGVSLGLKVTLYAAGETTLALPAPSVSSPGLVTGTSGSDTLAGTTGNDVLTGGLGADRFIVAAGTDRITDLGNGTGDTLNVLSGATANVTLAGNWSASTGSSNNGTITIGTAGFSADFSSATGSQGWGASNAGNSGATQLVGSGNADRLTGGTAADTLDGRGGDDGLFGGLGADRFTVGAGRDRVLDLGSGGTDVLVIGASATVDAELVAAWTASAASNNAGVANLRAGGFSVNLAAATGPGGWNVGNADLLVAVALTGSANADRLTGGEGNDNLTGLAGNDTIEGNGGADTLTGGSGQDLLIGGAGVDRFLVEAGTDTILDLGLGGADALVILGGAAANATLGADWVPTSASSNAGVASLATNGFGVNLASAGGTSGWDVSNAASVTAVSFTGSRVADTLTGGAGNDTLRGGAGNDTLIGGAGIDILSGNAGADRLTGGAGKDLFRFGSATETNGDIITDFQASQGDRIDLRSIDANSGQTGDQALSFIGSAAFAVGVAGQLRFADFLLTGDLNGDGVGDFSVGLTGVVSLLGTDILL